MAITYYQAYCLKDYLDIVTEIGVKQRIEQNIPPVLWSRGQRRQEWNLQPTLLRTVRSNELRNVKYSSTRALEESIRKQHYIAKNAHFFENEPKQDMEWYEVMQHHGINTRLLDWSESVFHSLTFSLECFFDNKQFRVEDRIECSPCIWILTPTQWNIKALHMILDDIDIINQCVDDSNMFDSRERRNIKIRIKQLNDNLDQYLSLMSIPHLKGIFNLANISAELDAMDKTELYNALTNKELYYCLYYIIKSIYMSTKSWQTNKVLPLSIVESYHSERIKAQKGTFSIFPYYREDEQFEQLKTMGIILDCMEYMHQGSEYLHKIMLYDPEKIAFEVMNAGINVTWLYPEMPIVSNAIEQRKIFTI